MSVSPITTDSDYDLDTVEFSMSMEEARNSVHKVTVNSSIDQNLHREDSRRISLTEKVLARRRLEKLIPGLFGSSKGQSWRERRELTSKKLPARWFLLLFTLAHFLENFLNSAGILSWYKDEMTSPAIFCPLSFQAIFTHFVINCERVYTAENHKPLPPEPILAWHPFNRPVSQGTLMLRFQFVLHFAAYIFPLVVNSNKLVPIFTLLSAPVLYYFFTAITVSINLEHTKVSENG